MSIKVLLPKAGMGTTEGTIAKWLKAEGDVVTQGEILVEIDCAKAIEEVPAPVSGTLRSILLTEGQTADVYTEIAIIDEAPVEGPGL